MRHIYLDTKNLEIADNYFIALKKLFESYGFEFCFDGELEKGSWIRKKISYLFSWLGNFVSPDEVARKTKHAIELSKIQKVQSEINKNNFEGAAAFINAVQHIDNVVTLMGSLAIVKTDGKELQIIELNTEQMILLENNPHLKNNPAALIAAINKNNQLGK